DIARLLYTNADSKPPVLVGNAAAASDGRPASVPFPLPSAVWSRAVFRHTVPAGQLAVAVLSDRRATLLARGLAGLDDETLNYFAEHPPLVTFLYERASAPFAAFGGVLKIREG